MLSSVPYLGIQCCDIYLKLANYVFDLLLLGLYILSNSKLSPMFRCGQYPQNRAVQEVRTRIELLDPDEGRQRYSETSVTLYQSTWCNIS